MKTATVLVFALSLALPTVESFAMTPEVKGRTGSTRAGGHSSHGKGSHYVGGRTTTAKKAPPSRKK